MRFLRPEALWLLLLAAIPVVMYLLPLPRLRKRMASTLLWQRVLRLQGISARRRLWRVLGAIVLNALILLLIISAFGRLWFGGDEGPSRGGLVVIMLDNSAGMKATDGTISRFDRARRLAMVFADCLPGETKLAVVTTAPSPRLLVRPTTDASSAIEAMRLAGPSDSSGSLSSTCRRLKDAFGEEGPTVHVFTDGADGASGDDPSGLRLIRHVVGEPVANAGIVGFGASRIEVPQRAVFVQARIANFSASQREVTLTLRASDGTAVDPRTLRLPPETEVSVDWTLPAIESGLVELEMTPGDAFGLDDRAAVVLRPALRKRVVLVAKTPPPHLLSALRADRSIRTFIVEPAKYRSNMSSDLTVFVETTPGPIGPENILLVNPKPGNPLVNVSGDVRDVGAIRFDAGHPFMADVTWRPGLIDKAPKSQTPPWAEVVLGDTDGPLVLAGTFEDRKAVVLNFDPETQPLARTRVLPILVRNIVEELAPQRPAVRAKSWRPGETVRVSVDETVTAATLVSPDGGETSVAPDEGFVEVRPDRVGLWRLEAGTEEVLIPVNLADAGESDLRGTDRLEASEDASGVLTPTLLWSIMIVSALVLVVTEAFLYHRRILE